MGDNGMTVLLERLTKIEDTLVELVRQRAVQEWYSTDQVAKILNKAPFTRANASNSTPIIAGGLIRTSVQAYDSPESVARSPEERMAATTRVGSIKKHFRRLQIRGSSAGHQHLLVRHRRPWRSAA